MITMKDFPLFIQSPVSYGGHVQGIAVDRKNGHIYFSFTTELLKCDLAGNLLGSVKGWVGHLGCIDFDDETGYVFGSLEIKNDSIGCSIKKLLNTDADIPDSFYIAVFDGGKITSEDIDANKTYIMRTSFVKECTEDYINKRYGCSGIDGTCVAPDIENNDGICDCLYTAYGIYRNNEKDLNDYQIILKYPLRDIIKNSAFFKDNPFHKAGCESFTDKYFVYTGNTNFGVQNLEYDGKTKDWFMAVYRGIKQYFPNYPCFAIDGSKKPFLSDVPNDPFRQKHKILHLKDIHNTGCATPGFDFLSGQFGLYSFDNGYFYIAKSLTTEDNGWFAQVQLYSLSYSEKQVFVEVQNEG